MSKFGLKNNMVLKVSASILVLTLLTGCGVGHTDGAIRQVGPEKEQATADKVFTYEETVAGAEGESDFTQYYSLSILGGSEAVLELKYQYDESYTSTAVYKGTYEKDGNHITFNYANPGVDSWEVSYWFTIEGDEIVAVRDGDTDYSEVAGEYTCNDGEYGDMTLVVDDNGGCTLKTSSFSLDGNIIFINDRWDIMVSNENMSVDWYVEFNGGSFTYSNYFAYDYAEYAGTLRAFGQLGDIDFVLSDDGTVTTAIMIDGKKCEFIGNYYTDSELHQVTSMYLTGEEYDLNLDFVDMNGKLNYSGSMSKLLPAG